MTESKPISLLELLQKSEFEAAKVGKGKLWLTAYQRERRTNNILYSVTKANLLVGIACDLEKPEPGLIQEIRIALDDRKIAQMLGKPEYAC